LRNVTELLPDHHHRQGGCATLPASRCPARLSSAANYFDSDDYRYSLDLLQSRKSESGLSIRPYCLTPYHVHRVVVPIRGHKVNRGTQGKLD
jgi:hypothetical protein